MSQKSKGRPTGRTFGGWGLPAVLVGGMVLAAVAGFVFVNQVLMAPSTPAATVGLDSKSLGAADAPVAFIEYGDFQ